MKTSAKQILRQGLKRAAITGGLEAAHALSRAGLMASARGRGVIFTLHHVRPKDDEAFHPNGHLEVTPEFLDRAIRQLKADGYTFAALGDVPALLDGPDSARPFAVFTLDDGYRNNAQHAAPVFIRHEVPFTIFVSGGFADRTHSIWWETAAALLRRTESLPFDFGAGPERLEAGTLIYKDVAFDRLAHFIIGDDEAAAVERLDAAALAHGVDPLALARSLTMSADELRHLAQHPLATLGAHTISHRALAFLDASEAEFEMRASADRVEAITGKRPVAIAYPYGDRRAVSGREMRQARDLGFSVAVTTQPGTLTRNTATRITGLPRVSLNGYYQVSRYVSALASGIPFRLMGKRITG